MGFFELSGVKIGGKGLFFILGPCVIESETLCLEIAEKLIKIKEKLCAGIIFKASFDKANRSSGKTFRGIGFEAGLNVLAKVKAKTGLPILTDIHEVSQVSHVSEVADILQIPAFLARQTDLLMTAAKTGKAVNVKKAQFMSPGEMKNVVDKLKEGGAKNIILTERGSAFGYQTLVVDFRSIPIVKSLGVPVVFDATHSVQKPGGLGDKSGGDRRYVPTLARAGVAAGCDGIFIETHPDPDQAKSDGPNMIALGDLERLIAGLIELRKTVTPILGEDGLF